MTIHHPGNAGPSHRAVEFGLAAATAIFGAIIMYGSWLVGTSWGIEGPRAGFFPFYIGLLILIGSLVNMYRAATMEPGKLYATWEELRRVLSVAVPAAIYVALMPVTGIYFASTLLIAVFMKWLGRYGWLLTLAVAIGLPVVLFMIFERWFLIPLPKGPIEDFLGF